MPVSSAGLLVHRRMPHGPEVLLVHPGGPWWRSRDLAAWSVPKGLPEAGETLEAAAKIFPEAGSLDYQIANIYYSMDKVADAFRHAQIALRKGNLPRIQQVRVFAGFLAFELKEFEAGATILEAAVKDDPNAKDAVRLLRAIKDIIAEREEALKPKS